MLTLQLQIDEPVQIKKWASDSVPSLIIVTRTRMVVTFSRYNNPEAKRNTSPPRNKGITDDFSNCIPRGDE
ncbi:MAG: hypothetical protein DHS20C16_25640 [Phycisphaerae bacterium]|nr:MAG: hypothetical protein DHS20C16_25640 [Phycisphaerae bacterium]